MKDREIKDRWEKEQKRKAELAKLNKYHGMSVNERLKMDEIKKQIMFENVTYDEVEHAII